MRKNTLDADVVVLGAGMAGLAAARALCEAGLRVVILEAQGRIGGRIVTQRIGGEVIELGAEFVHGRPPELLALIEEAGLRLVERTGSHLHVLGGVFVGEGDDNESDRKDGEDDLFAPLERLEEFTGPDLTFAEFLDRERIPDDRRQEIIGYVEGFNAADHRVISAAALGVQQKAEDSIEGDRAFHIVGGYDQLPAYLASQIEADGGRIRLDTRVESLEWKPGQVIALTNRGGVTAGCAIITVPLGVLQSGDLRFDPPLPEEIAACLSAGGPIRMGHVVRFTLHFRERFWTTLPQAGLGDLSFLFTRDELPSVWWTQHPEQSATLTGWVGGPRSELLSGLDTAELARRGCDALAGVFQVEHSYVRSLLLGAYRHDWSADPNSRGAYSYLAKDGLQASARLSTPVADTLFFAGEHTDTTGHWGTVHAALGSGIRAARQVLERLPSRRGQNEVVS